MSLFDFAGKLGDAKKALDVAEGVRREKTRAALQQVVTDARTRQGDTPGLVAENNLDRVLAASSQAHTVREIAKMLGVGDLVRSLVDRMEGGK